MTVCRCGSTNFGNVRRIDVDGELRLYRRCKACGLAKVLARERIAV